MIAVLLALGSALAFATATVVQHRAAATTPVQHGAAAALGLLVRLLRRPAWLAGQAAAILGLLLHALALRSGQVVVVQPLLASGLVLALGLGAVVDRRHPDRPLPDSGEWRAAALTAAGLAMFLLAARPKGGASTAAPVPMLACVLASLLLAGVVAVSTTRPTAAHRALWRGAAAGVGFGVTGLLLKDLIGRPLARWPTSWSLLGLVVVGAVAILMAQWAYQSGPLIQSLPAMTVLEPVVVILVAGPVYGERLTRGAPAHAGQLIGAVALLTGVFLLSRRTARREAEQQAALERAGDC